MREDEINEISEKQNHRNVDGDFDGGKRSPLASVSAASNWTSDTNGSLNVQPGKTYQFKISTDNPDKINFWMGTLGVFNVVYYKIAAVGMRQAFSDCR